MPGLAAKMQGGAAFKVEERQDQSGEQGDIGGDGGPFDAHFESKYKVEQHIKNLRIPYTIIGPTFFMENLLDQGSYKTKIYWI